MVQIKGKYKHERSENLDGYFAELGVPYLARKIMSTSNPVFEITEDENGLWTIAIKTLIRNMEIKFKLGEEYDELMPTSDKLVLKNVTTLSENKLETVSKSNTGLKFVRTYAFSELGMVVTMTSEQSGITANRYFRRI